MFYLYTSKCQSLTQIIPLPILVGRLLYKMTVKVKNNQIKFLIVSECAIEYFQNIETQRYIDIKSHILVVEYSIVCQKYVYLYRSV